MKQLLAALLMKLGIWRSGTGRWLRKQFALDRRYGVRFNAAGEKNGFWTYRAAEAWALYNKKKISSYIVFEYDAVDLWLSDVEKPEHAISSIPPEMQNTKETIQ